MSPVLKIEAVGSSETLQRIYQTTGYDILEDNNFVIATVNLANIVILIVLLVP